MRSRDRVRCQQEIFPKTPPFIFAASKVDSVGTHSVGTHYPEGSLFSDCEAARPELEALSLDRPGLVGQSVIADMNCTFSYVLLVS